MAEKTGMDVAVGICAIVGAVLGAFGSVIGAVNFVKACRKERIEAKHNLVKAEWRMGQTPTGRPAGDLYVVNCDTRPVSEIRVDFFTDADGANATLSWPCPGIPPGVGVLVQQFTGPGGPKSASFTYTDASGHQHGAYLQGNILKAG